MTYRYDIDGLRAIAVFAVIFFHLDFLPNGYLGVDMFFVISGFLITNIIYTESKNQSFSILKFYERRIRRIIPLLLLVSTIAFLFGLILMLPDDLENLAQSIIASNLSTNNILLFLTSEDYWAVANNYKPLMHTWSLAIEEQFYFLYPFIFILISKLNRKFIVPVLTFLTLVSIILFFVETDNVKKFFFLQYRFFELSIGGIGAIMYKKKIFEKAPVQILYVLVVLLLLVLGIPFGSNEMKILITTLLTVLILLLGVNYYESDRIYKLALSNNIFIYLGKISFSLYMWHQVFFAFARYAFVERITPSISLLLIILIIIASTISYYLIENPFRNKKIISIKPLLISLGMVFLLINFASFYTYSKGGILKDYPELGWVGNTRPQQKKLFSARDNVNIQYNAGAFKLARDFSLNNKIKTLVVGDSFGRDVCNILLESNINSKIDISYLEHTRVFNNNSAIKRFIEADRIIMAASDYFTYDYVHKIESMYKIKIAEKVWVFGIKDFGYSNGIPYNANRRNTINYKTFTVNMKEGFLEKNIKLKQEWGERYIDIIPLLSDKNNRILVFTPEGKFISQDTSHLTEYGAIFISNVVADILSKIFYI